MLLIRQLMSQIWKDESDIDYNSDIMVHGIKCRSGIEMEVLNLMETLFNEGTQWSRQQILKTLNNESTQ